jgi:ubiquinone/menaquinone biosynthesis C-methylase UbiE
MIAAVATQDYHAVSLDIWERMAEGWDRDRRWVWEVAHGVAEWMIDALDPQPGDTVLELAAGAGDIGLKVAEMVGEGGRLISTDFAPNMVEAARAEADRLGLANVEARVLNAMEMDLEDDSVDGVMCRWGYMLMADPAAALRETRRVLRDGGRLAMSVWGTPEENPWASIPARLVREQAGLPPPDRPAPGIFALADPERTRSLLTEAGFDILRMEDVGLSWTFDDFDAYWRFLHEHTGAIAVTLESLPDEGRQAVREQIEQDVDGYRGGPGYAIPGVAHNTVAA